MEESLPEVILIVCEGYTEAIYFQILQRTFRLPTMIKIIPDPSLAKQPTLGQHETLLRNSVQKREEYCKELANVDEEKIETWAVCDRDNYTESFTKLQQEAEKLNVRLAFSDPQFENFLLQHFSPSRSKERGKKVEGELSVAISKELSCTILYKKTDLTWLAELINQKHSIVRTAVTNANLHTNHTKQPFFTIQNLVEELLGLIEL